jgi:hypothetical protein
MSVIFQTISNSSSSNAATLTLIMPSPVVIGSLIVVPITLTLGGQSITSVTDTVGNTYSTVAASQGVGSSGNYTVVCYYTYNQSAGANTVTIHLSSTGDDIAAIVREYGEIDRSKALDKAAVTNGTGTAIASPASATTTTSKELVVAFMGASWTSGDAITTTAYNNLLSKNDASSVQTAIADTVTLGLAAQTASFTLNSSENWACGVATFPMTMPSFHAQTIRPHPFSPGLAR